MTGEAPRLDHGPDSEGEVAFRRIGFISGQRNYAQSREQNNRDALNPPIIASIAQHLIAFQGIAFQGYGSIGCKNQPSTFDL